MEKIRKARVTKSVAIGDVVIEDVDGEGANVIATAPYEQKE